MRPTMTLLALAAALTLATTLPADADNGSYTGAGGVFTTGTAAGQTISAQDVPLAGTSATLSFTCPITAYGAGTYQLNWSCAGGSVTISSPDNSVIFKGLLHSGTMTMSGSGGGKGGHAAYRYQFYGSVSGIVTVGGVTQSAHGSISQTVTTAAQLGAGTAPVASFSFGWNSDYSPLLVGDLTRSRILAADNIRGQNIVAFGSRGSGAGQFAAIAGLAEDAAGRIYATDSSLDRLVRIDDMTGTNWLELGSPGAGASQFSTPLGVAVDAAGKIWVADSGNNRVVRFDDMAGLNWTTFGTAGTGANQFSSPGAIAFDSAGRIYVADTGNNRVVRFDDLSGKNWVALSVINLPPYAYNLISPSGLAVGSDGKIFISLANGNLFSVSDMTGANATISQWGPSISGISLDESGTLYVAGGVNPGLAQAENAQGIGYFASSLGVTGLQAGAIQAARTISPTPAAPTLSARSISFGSGNLGEPGAAQKVYLSNQGSAPLNVASITASPDFKLATACPAELAGGATCGISLQFDPSATGARSGSLTVESTSLHPLLGVNLSGTGTAPAAVVSPAALSFLSQQTGVASGPQTVTLANTGTGPLTVSSIAATGDFTQTNNCAAVVAPSNSCTIVVLFTPSAAGARSGSLTITEDAVPGGAVLTVPLQGIGT